MIKNILTKIRSLRLPKISRFSFNRMGKGRKKSGLAVKGETNSEDVSSAQPVRAKSAAQQPGSGQALILKIYSYSQWLQLRSQPLLKRMDLAALRTWALILALAFVAASAVSTFTVTLVMSIGKVSSKAGPGDREASVPLNLNIRAKVGDETGTSAAELSKKILARNLFNSDGELAPEEVVETDDSKQTSGLDFESIACSAEKLPVAVLGTIFTGDPYSSYVTIKDPKVSYADTYKTGSLIIDYEDYEVYKVTRDKVEVRKGDQKICVEINENERDKKNAKTGEKSDAAKTEVKPENIVNLEFAAEELSQAIGPGYANILNSAKLIPAVEGGNVTGFKLIAIKSDSLFNRMKFQNRDIITEVNGVSLKDASEGFKLYQALQEEREINIRVLRDETPMTFMVRVK